MGPVSRAAVHKFQAALLDAVLHLTEEMQALRSSINHLTGRNALELESTNERIDGVDERFTRHDKRLTRLERAVGSSDQGAE